MKMHVENGHELAKLEREKEERNQISTRGRASFYMILIIPKP